MIKGNLFAFFLGKKQLFR